MVCVGIDVAKDKHDCFILSSEGEVLVDVFTIPNSMEGFQLLLEKIHNCVLLFTTLPSTSAFGTLSLPPILPRSELKASTTMWLCLMLPRNWCGLSTQWRSPDFLTSRSQPHKSSCTFLSWRPLGRLLPCALFLSCGSVSLLSIFSNSSLDF